MASQYDNDRFKQKIIDKWPLDEAIEYINKNLGPDDVFEDEELEKWAFRHGFTKTEIEEGE